MRIAILFDNFGPYHHARLRECSKLMDIVSIELGCLSSEYSWERQAATGFNHLVVNQNGPSGDMPFEDFKARLENILALSGVSAVAIPGWSSRGAVIALLWAARNRVPVILMSDSTIEDERRVFWKEAVKKKIVSMASAALVAGQPHANYVNILGMSSSQIFLGYDVVDNNYFEIESYKWQLKEPSPTEKCFFLASSRFVSKKNLPALLTSYSLYVNQRKIDHKAELWNLCLVGDGAMKGQLMEQCRALGLNIINSAPWEITTKDILGQHNINSEQGFVFFPGFRQVNELPRFYGSASVFVHASSTEQWGLVVNEAMACGLPILLSSRVGCSVDLLKDGVNGFIFDPQDTNGLANLMLMVANYNFPLQKFGDASRQIIADWSPIRFANGLVGASRVAIKIGPKYLSLLNKAFLMSLARR
jgi:1,2-diacylglycerol 3-alpha-glucosyltransferase